MRLLSVALWLAFGTVSANAGNLRILNWSEYIQPGVVDAFEAASGTHVVYDQYDSGEVVERRLHAEGSEYDLVVTSSEYLARLIEHGRLREIDISALSVSNDLSSDLMQQLARVDPGNRHAIPYLWGTTGIGFDRTAILARDPDAPLDSWSMVFDPEVVAKFADCGVSFIDSPEEVLGAALIYLGHDPNTLDPTLIAAAAAVLGAVSPYVDRFDSEQIWDMAEGRICLAIAWSTDILDAAEQAGDLREIGFALPVEGALLWYDTFVIPVDAANPDAALAFVDFLLQPERIAATTNYVWAPNANTAAFALIDPEVRDSPFVHPSPASMANLQPVLGRSIEQKQAFEVLWNEIKLGF